MNKIYFISTILISLICFDFRGQTRYLNPVFPSIDTANNIVYSVNQSVFLGEAFPVATGTSVPIGIDTTTIPPSPILFTMPALEMDIFEPTGDTVSERPLIIYLHTGTFAQIIRNGKATGSRTYDYATQAFCTNYAARGYVVANTEYRLGWNPILPTENERSASLMKAVYRAVQDVKSAVRYLRMDYENGNTYGIDTSKIIIVGEGTGGDIALAYATIDKLSELQLPKFLDPVTAVPLLDTAILGDWDGYGGNPAYNTTNNTGFSNKVHMVCNMGGMLMDLYWLEAGDVPIAAVHGNLDVNARFTTGNLSVSGVSIISSISGSHDVVKKANMLGNNSSIINSNDSYTVAAQNASNNLIGTQDFSGVVINDAPENLFPFVTGNPGEGAPWEYFDSLTSVALAVAQGLPASAGTDAYMSSLFTNPDVSLSKANAYIDSTLGFFSNKIYNTLIVNCNTVYGIDSIVSCDSLTWIDGTTYTSSNNTATHTLTSATGCDSVVTLDLIINSSVNGTDAMTACDSLTWIDGNTYTSSNNTATHTLTNAAGCDSVVTLDLTIYEFLTDFSESSVLFTGPPFVVQFANNTPNLTNYNFSWDFGDSTIEQNNNPSLFHEYMYNGLYDVTLISEDLTNGCGFDTLKKEDLIYCAGGPNLSIIEVFNIVNVFPNPTNDNVTISINNFNGKIQTEVFDLIGNRLQTTNERNISLKDYAKGIYILKLSYGDRVEEMKVIKD